jgi:hypothetical protein
MAVYSIYIYVVMSREENVCHLWIVVFWVVPPCSLEGGYNVSE